MFFFFFLFILFNGSLYASYSSRLTRVEFSMKIIRRNVSRDKRYGGMRIDSRKERAVFRKR